MVLISFDLEEFDAPKEFGHPLSAAHELEISRIGTERILDILDAYGGDVKATFFTTYFFAKHHPDLIARIVKSGHELASHGVNHSDFSEGDTVLSRQLLEQLVTKHTDLKDYKVVGFRMPRMQAVSAQQLFQDGYEYDASLNPTYIPRRYNNLSSPTSPFLDEAGLWQLPASVTPHTRFPLFWLAFHNLPFSIFNALAVRTYKRTNYFNIYFHPWEFVDLKREYEVKLPFYMKRNTGDVAGFRLRRLIHSLSDAGAGSAFITCSQALERCHQLDD